jgi:hypothetical protein
LSTEGEGSFSAFDDDEESFCEGWVTFFSVVDIPCEKKCSEEVKQRRRVAASFEPFKGDFGDQ